METDKLILKSSLQSPRIAKTLLNTQLGNLYFQTPRHTIKKQLLNQYDISSRTDNRLMEQKRDPEAHTPVIPSPVLVQSLSHLNYDKCDT